MLQRLPRTLPLWLAALWAMSLTTMGVLVVPMLFKFLPTPAMAGNMAAQLFQLQTGVSVACAVGLMLCLRSHTGTIARADAANLAVWILGGALLALLVELGVAPRIVARDNLALWHRVGSAMYLGQWACALVVFHRLASLSSVSASSR